MQFEKGVKYMECIITYQKSNGEIFIRAYKYHSLKKIGEESSMGWKVLDKHYLSYDGNYYHEQDYNRKQREKKETWKQKIAKLIMKKANAWI